MYLSGFGKFIYFNKNICLLQFNGFNILPVVDVTFWHVWNNLCIICYALVSRLQWIVINLHFSYFYIYCIDAYNNSDFPHPYLPTIITFWLDLNHDDTISISFNIDFVKYIFCIYSIF